MPFENPFMPESKKAKKSLLNKKIEAGKIWPESIKKVDELLKLGHYGELELYQKEVDFLNDLEKLILQTVQKTVHQPWHPSNLDKLVISMVGEIKNNSITTLNLGLDPNMFNPFGYLVNFSEVPKSIINLKKLKILNFRHNPVGILARRHLKKFLPNVEINFE